MAVKTQYWTREPDEESGTSGFGKSSKITPRKMQKWEKESGGGWKWVKRIIGFVVIIIAIWLVRATIHGFDTQYRTGGAEVVCSICGKRIAKSISYDIYPVDRRGLITQVLDYLNSGVEAAMSAADDGSGTKQSAIGKTHIDMCDSCAADFFAWTEYARGRKRG